jgi:drug/metabolite transporter (DMT)-like permease
MKLVLAYVVMIGFTVTGNLLLKIGATSAGSSGVLWNLLNWRVVAGLTSFALGAVFYVLILTRLPLNVAQSFAALQFVAVVVASLVVLNEPIGTLRWIGIAFIFAGILLVGKSLP